MCISFIFLVTNAINNSFQLSSPMTQLLAARSDSGLDWHCLTHGFPTLIWTALQVWLIEEVVGMCICVHMWRIMQSTSEFERIHKFHGQSSKQLHIQLTV